MTEIILVRHGQTAWNASEVFRGRADIELDDVGLKQAERLAEHLSRRKLEAIYSSPLRRALQTAEAIASRHRLTVRSTPGLTDIDFGQWQGLPHEEVKRRFGQLYARWLAEPHLARMPSGETLDEVLERALPVVHQAANRHRGSVVLVSHRVVSKVLICALLGLDNSHFWNIRLDTCGMTTFTHESRRWVLTEHNNTSFLEAEARLSDF
jgi:broad specificity phosphatase PhoE